MMIWIKSSYFTVGIEVKNDKVVKIAPIVKYMYGWDRQKVIDYCVSKQWYYEILQ